MRHRKQAKVQLVVNGKVKFVYIDITYNVGMGSGQIYWTI